ncbi:MAG: hypothetical protein LAT65_05275 [Saccharospirillum sp.]|nr:hypothetical protein [Saccharospirillum sp.]
MNWALLSLALPLLSAFWVLLVRRAVSETILFATLVSLTAALAAFYQVQSDPVQTLLLGDWTLPLAIRFELTSLNALLMVLTATIHFLVGLYNRFSRHGSGRYSDYWPLSAVLHSALVALWLSRDLFNWYVTLELLTLVAVALVTLSGPKAYRAALGYLVLSLIASLFYLLGVALLYGEYGVLDLDRLSALAVDSANTRLALLLMVLGLMLKAALWPLYLWLPDAHANAPTAVSALLSALVVKGPLFILWLTLTQIAPVEFAQQLGLIFALFGSVALLSGAWSALRTPYLKTLVAYSTVAQLGYALITLGLLLRWQTPELATALWLFVIAHALAKVSAFLAAGEMQATFGSKELIAVRGASQSMPLAMFAFAVAGGSLIGLPPSGGFLAKWILLQPLFAEPAHWPWALAILLGTLASAAYVFRVVALAFDRYDVETELPQTDALAQWLSLLPALVVWGLALISQPLMLWLSTGANP